MRSSYGTDAFCLLATKEWADRLESNSHAWKLPFITMISLLYLKMKQKGKKAFRLIMGFVALWYIMLWMCDDFNGIPVAQQIIINNNWINGIKKQIDVWQRFVRVHASSRRFFSFQNPFNGLSFALFWYVDRVFYGLCAIFSLDHNWPIYMNEFE